MTIYIRKKHRVKKKCKLFPKKIRWVKLIAHWDWPVCSIPWHCTCSPGNMPITSPRPDHSLHSVLRDSSTLPTRAPQTSLWPVTAPRGNAGTPFKVGWLKLQHRTQHLKIFKTKATCRCWFAAWSRVAPRPSGAVLQQTWAPGDESCHLQRGPGDSTTLTVFPSLTKSTLLPEVLTLLFLAPSSKQMGNSGFEEESGFWTSIIQRLLLLWGWGRMQMLPILIPKARVMRE